MVKIKSQGFTTTLMVGILFVVLAIAVVVGVKQFDRNQYQNRANSSPTPQASISSPNPTDQELKTFQSAIMKFSADIPVRYLTEEKLGSATISSDKGIITILRNATNFDNLKLYVKYSNNNLESRLVNRRDITINNLEATSALLENDEKIYLIYSNNTVYIISTKSKPLYNDLDQIAQSFRYIP